MIIVWRGIGLPIMMAGLGVTGIIFMLFDRVYLMNHGWPRLLAFGAGGALVYWLAWVRETKYEVRDSVYYIPMKVWAVLILAGGICCSFLPAEAFQVKARGTPAPRRAATESAARRPVNENGLRLQGILYSGDQNSTATINGQTVGVGEKVGGFTVRTITAQSVTLQAANGQVTVLRASDPGR